MPLLCRQASTHSVLELRLSRDVFDGQQAPSIPCFSLLCLIFKYTIPYHTIPYHTIPYHTIPYLAPQDDEPAAEARAHVTDSGPCVIYMFAYSCRVPLSFLPSPNARVPLFLRREPGSPRGCPSGSAGHPVWIAFGVGPTGVATAAHRARPELRRENVFVYCDRRVRALVCADFLTLCAYPRSADRM